jgi:hypothetical protein
MPQKNPLTLVASSEKALGSSVLVGGLKRDQIFLTASLDSIIKCSKRKKADAAAAYAGIMSVGAVPYTELELEGVRMFTVIRGARITWTLTRYDGLPGRS